MTTTNTETLPSMNGTGSGPPQNVVQAIARVMAELPGIGKDSKSPQGYAFRGIEAITAVAQKVMAHHCVVFAPRVVSRSVHDVTVGGKPWTMNELEVVYRVYGPGGPEDFIDVGPVWGLGLDNSDKGTNKALTQALKYAMIQVFCVGDSRDDTDHQSAELERHQSAELERHGSSQDSGPQLPNGWDSWGDCDAAHKEAVDAVKALPEGTDKSRLNTHRNDYGWPMAYDALVEFRRMVWEIQADASKPTREAPKAQGGDQSTSVEGECAWCGGEGLVAEYDDVLVCETCMGAPM